MVVEISAAQTHIPPKIDAFALALLLKDEMYLVRWELSLMPSAQPHWPP